MDTLRTALVAAALRRRRVERRRSGGHGSRRPLSTLYQVSKLRGRRVGCVNSPLADWEHFSLVAFGGHGRGETIIASGYQQRPILIVSVDSSLLGSAFPERNSLVFHCFRLWNSVGIVAVVVFSRHHRVFGNLVEVVIKKRESRVINIV